MKKGERFEKKPRQKRRLTNQKIEPVGSNRRANTKHYDRK